jgi:hypothetical protein
VPMWSLCRTPCFRQMRQRLRKTSLYLMRSCVRKVHVTKMHVCVTVCICCKNNNGKLKSGSIVECQNHSSAASDSTVRKKNDYHA